MKGEHITELEDEKWLMNLAFLCDITAELNDLNLNLQGKNKCLTDIMSTIKTFKETIKRVCLSKMTIHIFLLCPCVSHWDTIFAKPILSGFILNKRNVFVKFQILASCRSETLIFNIIPLNLLANQFLENPFLTYLYSTKVTYWDTINNLFYQCVRILKDGNQIRCMNALQTLCALVRGVYGKAHGDYGFDVINLLIGFSSAEHLMQVIFISFKKT
ncbi:UNVERIFIED_CONTAM: zgc [Trichonephila clavipes]